MSLHCEYLIYPRKSPQWRGRNLGQQCEQNRVVVVGGGDSMAKATEQGPNNRKMKITHFKAILNICGLLCRKNLPNQSF